ncbi:hypothetical protein C8D93_109203 [Sinimarinibacterium flocculans]|uniref:DUF2280 domain-containing protein n=1 Tax=Sinimarinibacterium flocculans TaxID=985250 RepID=A0A318E5Q3_9GAMM|nr:hypothetical protein C8D93_109203 [Sinimarinibacterium flocculans]
MTGTPVKLTSEHKARIVQALACFDTPSDVVNTLKSEFGVEITRQRVQQYDPTTSAGRQCARQWRELFAATRERFVKSIAEIPIAHRAYRLRALQRMAERAERLKNYALAAQLHEQAAKECGDDYTNRTRIDAKVQATARTVILPVKAS